MSVRAAIWKGPEAAVVHGTSMDFHGHGAPVASARRLSARRPDGQSGEGVLVGVVDTGMRSHPWLEGGYLASPDDFEPYDATALEAAAGLPSGHLLSGHLLSGHGAFVTGLILQQAQAAGVWVERALDTAGSARVDAVEKAARALVDRGVAVLNLSLGAYGDEPGISGQMAELVTDLHARNADLVVVCAAGNVADAEPPVTRDFYPAALREVVAVGAVEAAGREAPVHWAPWSNRGPWVDLAAPGTDLLSTYLYDQGAVPSPDDPSRAVLAAHAQPDNRFRGWARWSGTSFAAAVVTGVIASRMTGLGQTAQEVVTGLREGRQWEGRHVEGEPRVPVIHPADWCEELPDRDPGGADAARPCPWWGVH